MLLALLLLAACSDPKARVKEPDPPAEAPSLEAEEDTLFEPRRVLRLSIEMDPEDWEQLRFERRTLYDLLEGDCLAEPWESPFTWFEARLTFEGEDRGAVRVRKKGLIGSMSASRPSLKVDLEGQRIGGLEQLILNGTPQDPTLLRTCLAYASYNRLGVPAPRCTFATVRVNGEGLGLYSFVEAVDEAFTARRFGVEGGALFEGSLSDLREGWTGSYDPDSEEADPALLEPLVEALTLPDEELLPALEGLVDLEEFHRFWAAEIIAGQWDGYAANTNNYYIWLDPRDGRAHFLPWGPDAAWSAAEPFGGRSWGVAKAQLPLRLVQHSEGRQEHRQRLEELLDQWDAADLHGLAEEMEAEVSDDARISASELRGLLRVIDQTSPSIRRSLRDDELGELPALTDPPCLVERGAFSAAFSTTWQSGAEDYLSYGEASLSMDPEIGLLDEATGSCIAYTESNGYPVVLPVFVEGDRSLIPYIVLPPSALQPGRYELGQDSVDATLYLASPETGGQYAAVGWIGGELLLSEAGAASGAPLVGELRGALYTTPE